MIDSIVECDEFFSGTTMRTTVIQSVTTRDARFKLEPGAGTDSVHSEPVYSYAVTELHAGTGLKGTGLAFTLGPGNDLVCSAAAFLAQRLVGREIESLMAEFGTVWRGWTEHPQLRWLGPHKGVVHLALASVTNACFDLWAKARGVPLWRLLLDLSADEILRLLDLSYLEDVLPVEKARSILETHRGTRGDREGILTSGYPGYDTSAGWFDFSDEAIRENCRRAVESGFTALKLKVGSADASRDIRRAHLVRDVAGPAVRVMLDANQQWTVPQAMRVCRDLASMSPYWIEEPTHPDDILGHRTLARAIGPIRLAAGEALPNRVIFKNYLQSEAIAFAQVDATRVGGVSEFLAVSLLCRAFGVPVVPHVGDMGQIHQHLVLFNHIGLGHEALFLEHIPHLREHFVHPAEVRDGRYRTPSEPGASTELKPG